MQTHTNTLYIHTNNNDIPSYTLPIHMHTNIIHVLTACELRPWNFITELMDHCLITGTRHQITSQAYLILTSTPMLS